MARGMSPTALRGLIDTLENAIGGLKWRPPATVWTAYDPETSYSAAAAAHKGELVRAFLEKTRAGVVWDLGANTGRFSSTAADAGAYTVAFDSDCGATERHYQTCRSAGEARILPLVVDLANPSPASGWAHSEQSSWAARGPADAVLALALVHHLAIGHGVPLARIAELLAAICTDAIVEFVPKDDPQTQRLLAARPDVFGEYDQPGFERAFALHFSIRQSVPIRGSRRVMYMLQRP